MSGPDPSYDAAAPGDAWRVLGIDPTDDPGAVRRAYAARLKAIDADAEPRRFAALREAYEAARSGLGDPQPSARVAPGSAPAADPGPIGADRATIEALSARILDLVHGDRPTAAIEDELGDLTLRLIAEMERDTVDRQVDAEEWIVVTIVAAVPRSDAMIRPAVASFRWHERGHGQWRPDKATAVIDRLRELTFAERHVLDEGGRHHLAWRTLQAPPRSGLFVRPDLPALASLGPFFAEAGEFPKIAGLSFDVDLVWQWHRRLRRYDAALGRWERRRKAGWRYRIVPIGQGLLVAGIGGGVLALLFL